MGTGGDRGAAGSPISVRRVGWGQVQESQHRCRRASAGVLHTPFILYCNSTFKLQQNLRPTTAVGSKLTFNRQPEVKISPFQRRLQSSVGRLHAPLGKKKGIDTPPGQAVWPAPIFEASLTSPRCSPYRQTSLVATDGRQCCSGYLTERLPCGWRVSVPVDLRG